MENHFFTDASFWDSFQSFIISRGISAKSVAVKGKPAE
jgi:hypothetical protein